MQELSSGGAISCLAQVCAFGGPIWSWGDLEPARRYSNGMIPTQTGGVLELAS